MIDRLAVALADRYRVERELGAGGMATVYLAHDIKHDRDVAIKVLHPDLGAALGGERFLSEIRTTARLQHPHILPLLDSGEADGLLIYVMPLVTGETLRARLERERQLPIADALRVAREVASALDYAHRHGVIHRDIKPENILLHDGSALVADFGIALAVQQAGGQRMTQTGLSLGTPQYMSPEQAMGERTIDARSDIYALGAVTYEMLAGDAPFTGSSVQAIIAKVLNSEPERLSLLRKTVPSHVEQALLTALAKLPADRFESAKAFADALTLTSYTSTGHGSTERFAARSAPRVITRPFAAMSVLASLLLAVAAWALFTRPATRTAPVTRVGMELPDSLALVAPDVAPRLAISHDGTRVVFAGRVGTASPTQLWLRERDQLQARPLPGTDGASAPFFSPDGTRIAFYVGNAIKVVSIGGGPPQVLADSGLDPFANTAAWGPDDAIYASGQKGLLRIPVNGGTRTRVSTANYSLIETGHRLPDPLPNGRGVLFTIFRNPDPRTNRYDVAVLDLKTGKHRILVHGVMGRYARAGYLVFVRADGSVMAAPFDQGKLELTGPPVPLLDGVFISTFGAADVAIDSLGTLLYVRGRAAMGAELTWMDRAGRATPIPSTWPATDIDGLSISPDGRRVAAGVVTPTGSDIWIKQLDGGAQSRLTTDEAGYNGWPSWSPDGRRVIYSGEVKGHRIVQARRADGNGASEVLINESRFIFEAFVTRDSAWTVYRTTYYDRGHADIMARRTGDSAIAPLIATEADERHPTLSPNGRWLAYRSNESGKDEIYVRPFPNVGGDKIPVSTAGGGEPAWSHSGKELFYVNGAGALVSASVETQDHFVVGTQRVLFVIPPDFRRQSAGRMYDVALDDSRFIMVRGVERDRSVPDRLVLVTNWFDEVRAKMAAKR